MRGYSILLIILLLVACNPSKISIPVPIKLNAAWLDSIKVQSDTTYSKNYRSVKFAQAFYYINKKEHTLCQVMKDTGNNVRQIIITKNNVRTHYAEYYSNGQLMAQFAFDHFGQYQGKAKYYYENGVVESEGKYQSGFKFGEWNFYSDNGKLLKVCSYDANGQEVR